MPTVPEPERKLTRPKPPTIKVLMKDCQAGFGQIQSIDKVTGKPVMRRGGEFVRLPGKTYEIPASEAEPMIAAGQCVQIED